MVRSITMDSWKHTDILAMLEGGNKQLGDFFQRHGLSPQDSDPASSQDGHMNATNRYRTNAAKFYKKNLSLHATNVRDQGLYKGRDQFRKNSPQKKKRRIVNVDAKDKGKSPSEISSSPSQSKVQVSSNCSNECDSLRQRQQRAEESTGGVTQKA